MNKFDLIYLSQEANINIYKIPIYQVVIKLKFTSVDYLIKPTNYFILKRTSFFLIEFYFEFRLLGISMEFY